MIRPHQPLAALPLLLAVAAPAEVVRLNSEEAVARALAVSPELAARAHEEEAAAAAVALADAARLPILSLGATLARRSPVPEYRLPLGVVGEASPVLFPDIRTTAATSLTAQQPLYAGGAIQAGQRAARGEADAASATRLAAQAELRLQTRTAYWQTLAAQARVEAARATVERAQRLVADTQALLQAGLAIPADLLAAQERAASAQVALAGEETAAAIQRSRLASLLQLPLSDTLELADTLTTTLPSAPPPLESCLAQAAERPELKALQARRTSLHWREELALGAARPAVSLGAQWDLARPNSRYFPLAEEWDDSWALSVAVGWQLFDGGRTAAEAAAARATGRALEAQQEDTRRRIELEVETAWRQLSYALGTVEAAETALAAARERRRTSEERLAAGVGTVLDTLDAEAALAAAQKAVIEVRATAWLAAAALERAVGR